MNGGDGLGPDAPKLCRRCDRRRAAAANVAAAEPQRLRVVALWAAGYTSGEIADDLGWDPVSMKAYISKLRALGFPLAHRRPQMIPWGERVAAIRSRQRAAK